MPGTINVQTFRTDISGEVAVCILVWLPKKEYALGCNAFERIAIGVGYLSN